jgi:hypothetical protein
MPPPHFVLLCWALNTGNIGTGASEQRQTHARVSCEGFRAVEQEEEEDLVQAVRRKTQVFPLLSSHRTSSFLVVLLPAW